MSLETGPKVPANHCINFSRRVDQPVGTGYSIGKPTATTQEETAQDFIKFFKNFQKIFGIKNFKIYVTGESYAGRYVPYISAAMLDEKDKEYYDLQGKWMQRGRS